MDKIREYLAKPWFTAVIGFVVGLIIGLPFLGWLVFPVQWNDAAPKHLRADAQQDYLLMAVQSYSVNPDKALAQQRWADLGDTAPKLMEQLQADQKVDPKQLSKFNAVITGKPVAVEPANTDATPVPTEKPAKAEATKQPADKTKAAPTLSENEILLQTLMAGTPGAEAAVPATQTKSSTPWGLVLGLLCLLLLVVGGALLYLLVLRKNKGGSPARPTNQSRAESTQNAAASHSVEAGVDAQEAPMTQFMSTYMLGDDLYDDSFSIDSPQGEFMGECGMGISDTIGVGDPKKVTAFEVWLFDKNDIQTVTQVLMSEHAYNDPTIRQRLASKGEPVLITPDSEIVLETASLVLRGRVIDMNYGAGALPQNSFFERLTLELTIWPRS